MGGEALPRRMSERVCLRSDVEKGAKRRFKGLAMSGLCPQLCSSSQAIPWQSRPLRLLQVLLFSTFYFMLGRIFVSCWALAQAGSVRGSEGRTIAVEAIQASLQDAMQAVLSEDQVARRFGHIESSTWQTFQALPKNELGRLRPKAVRYLVHSYFMKEHGWLIQGLEPHGNQAEVSEVHEVNILQDKAPALVEALLEARRHNHGLSLNDCVTMIATLERLIFDESMALLQTAYDFNEVDVEGKADQAAIHEVLTSYLLLFQLGSKGNLTDARLHNALKLRVSRREDWPLLVEFQQDAVTWLLIFGRNGGKLRPGKHLELLQASCVKHVV